MVDDFDVVWTNHRSCRPAGVGGASVDPRAGEELATDALALDALALDEPADGDSLEHPTTDSIVRIATSATWNRERRTVKDFTAECYILVRSLSLNQARLTPRRTPAEPV